MNFYHWVIENITDFFYKKKAKVYTKEQEEPENNSNTKIGFPIFQYLVGSTRKKHTGWWQKKIPQIQYGNSKKWNSIYTNNHIINLTNYYKNNNDLYRISTQIRNFIPLNNDDINNIMKFEKNEILTIVLLQNYCLQHYKSYIDEIVSLQ